MGLCDAMIVFSFTSLKRDRVAKTGALLLILSITTEARMPQEVLSTLGENF